jgi:hypothetical protein
VRSSHTLLTIARRPRSSRTSRDRTGTHYLSNEEASHVGETTRRIQPCARCQVASSDDSTPRRGAARSRAREVLWTLTRWVYVRGSDSVPLTMPPARARGHRREPIERRSQTAPPSVNCPLRSGVDDARMAHVPPAMGGTARQRRLHHREPSVRNHGGGGSTAPISTVRRRVKMTFERSVLRCGLASPVMHDFVVALYRPSECRTPHLRASAM